MTMNYLDPCSIVWPDGSTDDAEFKKDLGNGHFDVYFNDRLMCVIPPMRVIPRVE